jgi:hypothetical protein
MTRVSSKPGGASSAADSRNGGVRANPSAKSMGDPSSAASKLPRGHRRVDPHSPVAPGSQLREGRVLLDAQSYHVLPNTLAGDQEPNDAHPVPVSGNPLGGGQWRTDAHFTIAAAELLFCAEFLDDTERVRIATENRLRAMSEAGVDATPYEDQLIAFIKLEHEAILALQRVMRRHPLGPWVKATKGVGEKQGARLLAAIGDITYNHAAGRPRRGPAELWAYCGYSVVAGDQDSGAAHAVTVPGVAVKRRKGIRSNWNTTAKMRAFLVAESCIKCMDSPYRAVYDKARASWADRDIKDGHKHNHALRLTAKAILKDLFLAAREVGA